MITVRFPSGFSVQYNSANFVVRHAEYSDLLTKQDGSLIAQVPNTALIEWQQPCRTYHAVADDHTEIVLSVMRSEFKTMQRQLLALQPKRKR